VAIACLAAPAAANPFDLHGLGSRGAAMAGANTASARDYAGVYYNPATMVLSPPCAGAGGFFTANELQIRLAERPAGYDNPDDDDSHIGVGYLLNDRADPPTPASSAFIEIGATSALGSDAFRVGFVAALPLASSVPARSVFSDERQQYFSNTLQFDLLGVRVEHATILFAAARRFTPWLSIGAGLSYMPSTRTTNEAYLADPLNPGRMDLNVGLEIPASIKPTAGLLLTPLPGLNLALAYRAEQKMAFTGTTTVQLLGSHDDPAVADAYPFKQPMNIVMNYTPTQVALGAAGTLGDTELNLDAVWSQWSNFVDNHDHRPGFNDTWSLRLGAEQKLGEANWLRAGFGWEPTPVPDMRGRYNYVDNDRVVASGGMGRDFALGGSKVRMGVHAQFQGLIERSVTKRAAAAYPACGSDDSLICDESPDVPVTPGAPPGNPGLQTANPGFPGWSSGGWLASFGIDATWSF
jgi:hypothetical protein